MVEGIPQGLREGYLIPADDFYRGLGNEFGFRNNLARPSMMNSERSYEWRFYYEI